MDAEKLKAILKSEYGIGSYEELKKAISSLEGIDIGMFVGGEYETDCD